MHGRRWSVACTRVSASKWLCKCARMRANGMCVYVCIGVCTYKKEETREVYTHAWRTKLNEDAHVVACVNKMVFGTQRHRETGTLVSRYFFLLFTRVRARRPTSSRAYAYTRVYLTIYYLQYNWERILFRLIPRSNSRYSVCAKTCPIWNSLRCGLYANP